MASPLIHPSAIIVSGPSQAGKSQWVSKLIRSSDTMIVPPPRKVIMCYSEWQPLYDSMPNVKFHKGLIDIETLTSEEPKLLILDDLMDLLAKKEGEIISQIFTKHCHHRNLSVVLITQNLFHKGGHMRNCQLNSHYQVLFKNPRDKTQISCLARQMYPSKGQSKFMLDAFNDATSVKYGCLVVDLRQETDDILRLKTKKFPDESTYVYVTRDKANQLSQPSRGGNTDVQ